MAFQIRDLLVTHLPTAAVKAGAHAGECTDDTCNEVTIPGPHPVHTDDCNPAHENPAGDPAKLARGLLQQALTPLTPHGNPAGCGDCNSCTDLTSRPEQNPAADPSPYLAALKAAVQHAIAVADTGSQKAAPAPTKPADLDQMERSLQGALDQVRAQKAKQSP